MLLQFFVFFYMVLSWLELVFFDWFVFVFFCDGVRIMKEKERLFKIVMSINYMFLRMSLILEVQFFRFQFIQGFCLCVCGFVDFWFLLCFQRYIRLRIEFFFGSFRVELLLLSEFVFIFVFFFIKGQFQLFLVWSF